MLTGRRKQSVTRTLRSLSHSLLHAPPVLKPPRSPPLSPFCFVSGLLLGAVRLQCQLHPHGDSHLHQPRPAVAGAAHPGLLRGPVADQSVPSLRSPHPVDWGLLQSGNGEDRVGQQSAEHRPKGQSRAGEHHALPNREGEPPTLLTALPDQEPCLQAPFPRLSDSDSWTQEVLLTVSPRQLPTPLARTRLCSLPGDLTLNANRTQPANCRLEKRL